MKKTCLAPIYFSERNEREEREYHQQLSVIEEIYGEVMELLPSVPLGAEIDIRADAVLFPQMIYAAFRHDDFMKRYQQYSILVITSRFGTVEMWDWEIITYLRSLGLKIFAPYNTELAKTILRALSVRANIGNARFLMFQDSPGEGMQANIFKKFYWWEKQSTQTMEELYGCKIIYRSWKEVCSQANLVSDSEAKEEMERFRPKSEGLPECSLLKAAKLYVAVKRVIEEIGGVEAVGSNCLNESFYCETTPCLAWNMLFELDDIIWACEGDTLSMLSTYILYRSIEKPMMMTNLYPYLVGMAALSHEKIDSFPEVPEKENCALGVHCGYFGFAPRCFCTEWTLRPKVLEIVQDESVCIDGRFPCGKITLAKIYPGFQKLNIIQAELEDYVQYPESDCRNGALIRYKDGAEVMDGLCSHHSLIIVGDVKQQLLKVAEVFGWIAHCL